MARPKRDSGQMPAFERMEEAFWQLLEERPFHKITISALSKAAGVNHNLIYYYFENMEDLARQMFERNMGGGFSRQIISFVLEGTVPQEGLFQDPEALGRVRRSRLFMRSDSAFLNGLVKERFQQEWLAAVGVDRTRLTAQQRVDLEFLVSGIIAVVGSQLFEEDLMALATLYQRPLGWAAVETLKRFGREG